MRNRPVFQPNPSPSQDQNPGPGGCLWAILITAGGYFVFRAIDRVLAGEWSLLTWSYGRVASDVR